MSNKPKRPSTLVTREGSLLEAALNTEESDSPVGATDCKFGSARLDSQGVMNVSIQVNDVLGVRNPPDVEEPTSDRPNIGSIANDIAAVAAEANPPP